MTVDAYSTSQRICGHVGIVRTKENERPYSSNWDIYGLSKQAPTTEPHQ